MVRLPFDRSALWLALLAGAALAVLAAASTDWFTGRHRSPFSTANVKLPLQILITGDTQGWLTPCGCVSNQSGGLLRRGAFVRGRRANHDVVLLDAGGAAGGTSPYDRAKFEAILDGELLMGLTAHNLGMRELALGPAYLRQLASRKRVPFLSANATDGEGQRVADAYRIVAAADKRLAIVGVVSPRFATTECRISDPQAAILATRLALADQFDSLVVLAYLPEEELRALAAALPEADAIVGGPTGQSIAPEQVGPVLLASATNKGKFLVALEPAENSQGWQGQIVEMTADYADDESQVANVALFRTLLAERDFTAVESGMDEANSIFTNSTHNLAGTSACRECHRSESDSWNASAHARAWNSLTAVQAQVDSYCQQCHTTGFGLPGGFVSANRSRDRINVGCESCHGPSQAHAGMPRERTPWTAADTCVRCHDRENSPQFDFVRYWPRVAHGKEPQ